jgi:hypothetical protein
MITCLSGLELMLFLQMIAVEPTMLDNNTALMFPGSDIPAVHVWHLTDQVAMDGYYIWCYDENTLDSD